ncbi:MAG: 4'-phosphopantetheinyl transferase superfamily protein [Elusimicrobiota bacterium]
MTSSTPGRPPYRLAYCPRAEAERALELPQDVRERFSAAELAEIEALSRHRRLDRLSGRLAAKRALAAHFSAEWGWEADARELEIANDPDGRPLLRLPKGAPAQAPSFSISHCAEGGAAAVAAPGRRVGVDLELVVARPAEVIAFVSAPGEDRLAPPTDPEAQARLWTGKEAGLKLLGLGLDADARDVGLTGGEIRYAGRPAAAWRALGSPRVRAAFERAGAAMLAVAYTGD